MSMGYDYDDPRDKEVRERLASGYYRAEPGKEAAIYRSKRQAGAMPGRFGLKGMGR